MNARSATLQKPLLRGHSHQAAFFVALGACSLPIAKTPSDESFLAALVYSFGLLFLFGASTIYHRPHWKPDQRALMKRLDHSAIYVFIAGTATPIALLALPPESTSELLKVIWGVALLGILKSVFWTRAPKWLSAILYVAMGWIAVPYIDNLESGLGLNNLRLILAGGIAYTVGALCYALRFPKLRPELFGYHEVFHLLTIVGAALHFIVIYRLI